MNTAVLANSRITYIDGEKGILRYRGIPIEQLAEKSTFLETAYLLIYGELPTAKQFNLFETEVLHHTFTHSDLDRLVSSFRCKRGFVQPAIFGSSAESLLASLDDAHPMAILSASFAALGAFAPEANPSLQGQNLYTQAAKGDKAALAVMDKVCTAPS